MKIVRVVKDSLKIVWTHKSLWLFGLFVAGGSGSGGGGNGGGTGGTVGGMAGDGSLPAWVIPLIIAGAVIGIAALIMHVISEGALIEGVARSQRGEKPTIREGMRAGADSFWAVFKVKLLMIGIAFGSTLLLAGPALGAAAAGLPTAAIVVLGVVGALVGIPWLITVYIVYNLSLRFVVLENRRALDAVGKARIFLHSRLAPALKLLIAEALGQFAVGIVALPILLVVAIVGLPAYFIGGLTPAIVAAAVVAVPLGIAVIGALGTYRSSIWTVGFLTEKA